MKDKLRLLVLPFLFIGLSVIGLYTLLNWLLFIQFDLFPLKESIRNYGLPIAFSLMAVWIWLAPRIKLLKAEQLPGNRDPYFYYGLIATAVIALSTILAQEYITIASGKLTQLPSIHSIQKGEKTKFYMIQKYFVSKYDVGVHWSAEVTGSHDQNLWLYLFLTLPIYESEADSAQKISPAWLGIKYSKQISNELSEEEKKIKLREFTEKTQEEFDAKDFQQFVYLDRIGYSDDLIGYQAAMKTSAKFHPEHSIVLIPINAPFEARNGYKFAWIFVSFGIGAFIWFMILCFSKLDEKKLDHFLNGIREEEEEEGGFISFFIPRQDYFVTPILVNLNVGIYLIMALLGYGFISMNATDLLNWGANYRPAVKQGEYWRLLSSIFLHGGIMHIAGNMFSLIFVGMCLEPILGRIKFVVAYLLTGLIASLASIYWYEAIISVGASGAIFGLNGLFLVLILTDTLPAEFQLSSKFESPFLVPIGVSLGVNLVVGMIGTENVDNAAHIGGLLSGIFLGILLAIQSRMTSILKQT